MDGPCPPGFGPFVVSSGFYHRIAFALPFGLACTHAGVWQCRPAVTLSGRSTSDARFSASAVPSFTRPLQRPGAGIPAGTDEMYVVLHLLSHGASWRTSDYYGSSAPSRRHPPTTRVPARQPTTGRRGDRRNGSHVRCMTAYRVRRPALPLRPRHTYAAGFRRGLPDGDFNRTRSCPTQRAGTRRYPAHIRQIGAGGSLLRGFRTLVSHVHLPVLLAGPRSSGSADPSRRCRGCSHPPRRSPDQAAPSFHQPAATSWQKRPLTSSRSCNASWRTKSKAHT